MLCGGDVPALGGLGLPAPLKLVDPVFTRIGDDVRLRARIG